MNRHPDDGDDHLATPAEAVQEYARNAGADHPEQAWLLHDWDVWVRNPHYRGPPVRHPEDDSDAYDEPQPKRKLCPDCGWPLPRFDCPHQGCNGVALHKIDDEIPF